MGEAAQTAGPGIIRSLHQSVRPSENRSRSFQFGRTSFRHFVCSQTRCALAPVVPVVCSEMNRC